VSAERDVEVGAEGETQKLTCDGQGCRPKFA
jgi:hypothetical protein